MPIFPALAQEDNVPVLDPTCKNSDWLGSYAKWGKQPSADTTPDMFEALNSRADSEIWNEVNVCLPQRLCRNYHVLKSYT